MKQKHYGLACNICSHSFEVRSWITPSQEQLHILHQYGLYPIIVVDQLGNESAELEPRFVICPKCDKIVIMSKVLGTVRSEEWR